MVVLAKASMAVLTSAAATRNNRLPRRASTRSKPPPVSRARWAFAEAGDNVVGQHLSTRDRLGYVVTDASEPLSAEALATLRASEHCVWVRTW